MSVTDARAVLAALEAAVESAQRGTAVDVGG
jgi:hypothetical protein